MFYNVLKNLSKVTLALTLVLFGVNSSFAQGTVSLADDIEDELGIDSNVPDEISLFDQEDLEDLDSGLIQPVSRRVETVTTTTTVTENVNDVTENVNDNAPESTISLSDEGLDLIENYNNSNPFPTSKAPVVIDDNFGEDLLTQIDDKLFSQMSDIEKQTALLTLELRRERIKTEIDAVRLQRQKAIELEEEAKELKARERAEWETEQQRKLIEEQVKLQEENVRLEKLRQEKVLNAYKNEMLKTNQKWVDALNGAYNEARAVEAERAEHLEEFKTKLTSLASLAQTLGNDAITAKENYDREIQNLQTQISILSSRVETLSKEKAEGYAAQGGVLDVDNPFANPAFGTNSDPEMKLGDEYLVLEIRGKGEDMTAKLSNKTGSEAFFVRKGTKLKSGHIIEEITPTFIRADKKGEKDFIYFSAGGVLDTEPDADVKIKNVPMGRNDGDAASSATRGTGYAGSEAPKAYVSDSFIEQMFAE
ncbi:MAG: hypothetical protein LBR70_00165 [Lactobacillaceae bacterium]|nr:hypothetical protein [Lactobacillaceae bacterium]